MPNELSLDYLFKLLKSVNNTEEVLTLLAVEILIWTLVSFILVLFIPKKYKVHQKEIFLFFLVINIGLLFVGILLTLIMILFGLSWATNRISRPHYQMVYFQEQIADFPMVSSTFDEGLLSVDNEYKGSSSSNEKIKSLKIIYDTNAQGNIGKIQHFLADSSDETRLYAFALVSTFEKKLNQQIKETQEKIAGADNPKDTEQYLYELAQIYWQFIYHGVASTQLTGFYTQKIEKILAAIQSNTSSFILLGKIKIFNKEYDQAEKYFNKAMSLGVPQTALSTFLAEIKYGQKKFDEVEQHILAEEFEIDLRLKPLISVWKSA